MKKIYLILFAITSICISINGANLTKDYNRNSYKKHQKHYKNSKEARLAEIDYKLDILDDKYKRDENRLKQKNMDKYDYNIAKKELKHQYKMEKNRLKAEKKSIKDGSCCG